MGLVTTAVAEYKVTREGLERCLGWVPSWGPMLLYLLKKKKHFLYCRKFGNTKYIKKEIKIFCNSSC